ncbi:MAG: putative Ig domain-containing protein [Planctomycetota bacterium]|jgi:hypothetical protein
MISCFTKARAQRVAWLPFTGLALALALIAGCSENQSSVFDEFVQSPSPQPRLIDPAPGSTGVSPLPTIQMIYEGALVPSTVDANAIKLFDLDPGGEKEVPIAISLIQSNFGIQIQPISQLVAPRKHEVRIFGFTQGIRFAQDNLRIDDFTFRFTTSEDPTITTLSLPDGVSGNAYNQTLATVGGSPALVFTVSSGTLPGGLTLDTASGAITGTPNVTGTFSFEVTVTDQLARQGVSNLSITVN